MRVALAVLAAVGLTMPASAQSRYAAACVAAAEGDPMGAEVCACGEASALKAGAVSANLDALVDYVGADQTLDVESVPDALRPTADVALSSLAACALEMWGAGVAGLESVSGASLTRGYAESFDPDVPAVVSVQPGAGGQPDAGGRARKAAAPVGRPGVPARATQASAGAVIRIRG